MTYAETFLWHQLRRRQLNNLRFRRQYGVGPYTLDFYCASIRLGIELDGASHDNASAKAHDERKQRFIGQKGITVLRFKDEFVVQHVDNVLEIITKMGQAIRTKNSL